MGVLETKTKEKKSANIVQKVVPTWKNCMNYPQLIIVEYDWLWQVHIQVQVFVVYEQFINGEINEIATNLSAYLNVVYDRNKNHQRKLMEGDNTTK